MKIETNIQPKQRKDGAVQVWPDNPATSLCCNPYSLDRRPGDHQADGQLPHYQAR